MHTENQALEHASQALGVLEQLSITLRDIEDTVKTIPATYRVSFDPILERWRLLMEVLEQDDELVPELVKGRKLSDVASSKIERLKIGKEIIRLREVDGLTYSEIADRMLVDASTVSKFCKFYDSQKPAVRSRYQRTSIFDTSQNFENLGAMIYRSLANLENVDPENHVKYISELRQTIGAAQKWMEQVSSHHKYDILKQAIIDILYDELPEKREAIIKRFQSVGAAQVLTGS